MKSKKLLKKAKASARTHYVRKKEFSKLVAQVRDLKKAIALLTEKQETTDPPETAAEAGDIEQEVAPDFNDDDDDDDDLKQIKGIGPVLERKLRALGITRFAQIAAWSQGDVDEISGHLDFKGRIEREDWIKQATALSNP